MIGSFNSEMTIGLARLVDADGERLSANDKNSLIDKLLTPID